MEKVSWGRCAGGSPMGWWRLYDFLTVNSRFHYLILPPRTSIKFNSTVCYPELSEIWLPLIIVCVLPLSWSFSFTLGTPKHMFFFYLYISVDLFITRKNAFFLDFPCGSAGKESACNVRDLGLTPGLGRSPGEGKGYPLQYSGLENSMGCIVDI